MIPVLFIVAATVAFFIVERVLPGRDLPEAPGWYARAVFLNLCQVGMVLLAGLAWNRWLQSWNAFHISKGMPPFLQGFIGWFVGTFVFYWWHRARHDSDSLWRIFHQIHHSPARIEVLTAFYKHPIEIAADSVIASALMFSFLGASPAGGAWFNVLLRWVSISITAICALLVGSDTSFKGPSIIQFIINSISISSTTGTLLGGIASLERFEIQMPSRQTADFLTTMRGIL